MSLKALLESFGGDKGEIEEKYIGSSGVLCVNRRGNEGWVLKI